MRKITLLGLAAAALALWMPDTAMAQLNENYDVCLQTCFKTVDTPLPGPCDSIKAVAPTVPMTGGQCVGASPIGNWDVCMWWQGNAGRSAPFNGAPSETICSDIGNCATSLWITAVFNGASFSTNTSIIQNSTVGAVPTAAAGDLFWFVGRDTSAAYGGNGNDVVSGEALFDPADAVLYNTTDTAYMIPSIGAMSCRMWFIDTLIVASAGENRDRHCGAGGGQRNMVFEDHSMAIGVKETPTPSVPREFALAQNYPNPFNPTTNIKFTVPTTAKVNLTVTNALGQTVKTLVNEEKGTGTYEATWDATNDRGEKVVTGVYFYSMTAGSFSAKRRMVLQK